MKTLLIATIVAMSASLVSAECAWIFWMKQPGFSKPDRWTIGDNFATQQGCLQHQVEALNKMKNRPGTEVRGATIITKQKALFGEGEDISILETYCIPDTIDPRK